MDRADVRALEQAFATLGTQLQKYGKYTPSDLLGLLVKPTNVPATLFRSKISPLEALVHCTRDHRAKDAAALLGRSASNISAARATLHSKEIGIVESTQYSVPIEVFADRTYSVLEHVVHYLKEQFGLRNNEIAELIGKDQRVVGTLLSRVRKKGGAHA